MEVKKGELAWWLRMGDDGPFETLVKVASEPNEVRGIKVNLIIYQKGAASPVTVERDSNTKYLHPFVQGDERVWEKLAPGLGWQKFYTAVRVVRMEETGLLFCTCDRCPHSFNEGTTTGHLILPRYIKNPAHLVIKSMSCRSPVLPTAITIQSPVAQKPVDTAVAVDKRAFDILKQVVIDLATGKIPQPEDIDYLTGDLGKGPEYAIPVHDKK